MSVPGAHDKIGNALLKQNDLEGVLAYRQGLGIRDRLAYIGASRSRNGAAIGERRFEHARASLRFALAAILQEEEKERARAFAIDRVDHRPSLFACSDKLSAG